MDSAKERIREYIKSQGVTYAEAERLAGLTRGYLNVDSEVSTSVLRRIVSVFPGMDLYYIIMGAPPKSSTRQFLNSLISQIEHFKAINNEKN